MIAALKSEFRKLFSVRSTYTLLLVALILEIIFAFYGDGIKAAPEALKNTGYLAGEIINAAQAISIFVALAGVLLIANEYRHNTIMYTLTSSNSRTRVLLAKTVCVSVFAVVFTIILGFLSPVFTALGLHAGGHQYVEQSIPIWSSLWRIAFYGWGFAMFGLIAAFIVRNQIGAIVTLFALPTTIEPLIGHLFKTAGHYFPFTLLGQVLQPLFAAEQQAGPKGAGPHDLLSYGHAALLYLIYVAVGGLVAWILFIRRDAN